LSHTSVVDELMINLNEYHLRVILSLEILNLCPELVSADSHVSNAKTFGQFCWSSIECQVNSHCQRASETHRHGTCQCIPGFIRTDTWLECVEPRRYDQPCDMSHQCQHYDPHTVCETGAHGVTRCLCADYYRYNSADNRCQWCDDDECRLFSQSSTPMTNTYNEKYNRWYHNVNGIFGIWASLLIMALPISLFLFFVGLRFAKQLLHPNHTPSDSHRNALNSLISQSMAPSQIFVTLPHEVITPEPPPTYEELIKSSRLPTYEEALNNMFC
jgi:hypothetical protein